MSMIERFKLNSWKLEMVTLGFTIVFVILFKLGDYYNKNLVTKYLNGLSAVFTENFFQYGVNKDTLYVKDSSENYSSYATGRINIAKVNITFRLKPRHNPFVLLLETVFGYFTESVPAPTDKVEIVITPSNDVEYDNFIQAIVSKIGMNDFRKFNYFLSLTRTTDSSLIPQSFVYMSEVNEIQEKLITSELRDSLTLEAASFLKFIAFTDQSSEKPEAIKDLLPRRKIVITTDLIGNKEYLSQLSSILSAVFSIVDKLANKSITFKPETLKKIVKTREIEVAKIQKLFDDAKEQELAEERAKVKQQEKDKLRSLSRDEQIKLEKKALEKKQRKQQKKNRVKM